MKLISIGGASRSGSTLLSLLLGKVEGIFAVGELRYIWSRGWQQNMLCGCGAPFLDCPFWEAVFGEAYGDPRSVPVDEISALQDSVAQIWHLPQLLSPRRTAGFASRLRAYLSHLERLCTAIQKVSGASIIVDSSKLPSYCYVLSRLPGAEVTILHLVRDSRAVAFSFLRKKRKPDIHWTEAYMPRFSPLRSARDWNLLNLGMEAIARTRVPCKFMRYEDFVRDCRTELSKILSPESLPAGSLPSNGEVPLSENHTVSGNPLRFSQGPVHIRPDTEWKTSMATLDYRLVTVLTWPLLARYQYTSAQVIHAH
jgi:hypothetical protein